MPAAGAAAPTIDEGAGQPQEDPELPEQRPREGGRSSFMRPLVVLAYPGCISSTSTTSTGRSNASCPVEE